MGLLSKLKKSFQPKNDQTTMQESNPKQKSNSGHTQSKSSQQNSQTKLSTSDKWGYDVKSNANKNPSNSPIHDEPIAIARKSKNQQTNHKNDKATQASAAYNDVYNNTSRPDQRGSRSFDNSTRSSTPLLFSISGCSSIKSHRGSSNH